MAEKIPKINDRDEIIGETTIAEAKNNGWYRRISRVFLFDGKGNILLQRRGPGVHSYPNKLDQSAGGHVDLGETYEAAAYREMKEELGVEGIGLKEIITSYRNRDCFEAVYVGLISHDQVFSPDAREVSELVWMSVADFEEGLRNNSNVEGDFIEVLDRFWFDNRDKILV